VCLSAGLAPVPDVDLLGRLVPSGNLGELPHVSDCAPPCFLAIDPVEAGGLALLDLLHLVGLVIPAEWTIGLEFYWHFHDIFLRTTRYRISVLFARVDI